jgi:hypothetical protein
MDGLVDETYPVIDESFEYKPVDKKRYKKYSDVSDDQRNKMKFTMGQPRGNQV